WGHRFQLKSVPIAAATVPLGYLRVAHVPVELFPLLADEALIPAGMSSMNQPLPR
ncbi:hypothetical protein pipiens_006529, partial [Culex pipiens pipiens]